MLLFRSGEHRDRWLDGRTPGATIPVTTLCDLAHQWWGNRLDPGWRPRSRDDSQSILEGLDLTGEFWRLG